MGVARAGNPREILLNQVGYAPFGPATGWTYGNGRSLTRAYNQNYQPVAIQDTIVGGLDWGFGFDAVGNLAVLTRAANPAPVVSFDYDNLNRLTAFRDQPANVAIESYAYDKTGNRTSFTNAGGTQAYTYPAGNHRLSSVGATARTYDAAGNTTQIGGTNRQFVYDDSGRMSQVKSKNKATMNYAYNGKGEQVRKYLGTASTYAMYDEAGHWLGDYDTNGVAIQQAIWLDDMPVGVIANNQLHYIEPDHLGTPRVVIHPVRNVAVWSWDLRGEAFGNNSPNQNPDGDASQFVFNLRFPGQRYDSTTGLNYNYFRDYDATTGRYVQSDPVGLHGGMTTYSYGGGTPILAIDIFGLKDTCRRESNSGSDWFKTGKTKETILSSKLYLRDCIPLARFGPMWSIDPSPDPGRFLRNRKFLPPTSPPLPIELYLLCKNKYLQKFMKEEQELRVIVWSEVCRNECGQVTRTTYLTQDESERWAKAGEGFRVIDGDSYTIPEDALR